MRLLLDTHIAVWVAVNPARLSEREAAVLRDDTVSFAVSAVSFWELRLKWNSFFQSGDRKGPVDPVVALRALQLIEMDMIWLDPATAAAELKIPLVHKDPFDEQLLIQAQHGGMRLWTRDKKLLGHPLAFTAP